MQLKKPHQEVDEALVCVCFDARQMNLVGSLNVTVLRKCDEIPHHRLHQRCKNRSTILPHRVDEVSSGNEHDGLRS